MAVQSGVPIIPVAIHGSSKVRNWKRGQFPKVFVKYGDPMRWDVVENPHWIYPGEVLRIPGAVGFHVEALPGDIDPVERSRVPHRTLGELADQSAFSNAGTTDNSLVAAGNSFIIENNYGYGGPTSTVAVIHRVAPPATTIAIVAKRAKRSGGAEVPYGRGEGPSPR